MAIPIGPLGVMCIRKTLNKGHSEALVIGLGAATADLLYSSIAAFGVTIISNFISNNKFWFNLIGGFVLLFLGLSVYRKSFTENKESIKEQGYFKTYISTILLTFTNPTTIFAFLAVYTALGFGSKLDLYSAFLLVTGVFTGTFLWFTTLSYSSMYFWNRFNLKGLSFVNKIAGILIIISGLYALLSI